ncbi:ATP-binding protein [Cylindrospermum sp. FACHB-282]|uniref:ATP-binding protein n=1 Tax=Cylindrospermum sp. FACHB-282 TaxID=2692794 RepID=UPI0016832EE4|nr:ATP-binding protein [Cylindrospermum sp. FACHB-282]MBD2386548.1 ATP-binding protein [Cylindrospermum sp. FACHB-282]
MVYAFVTVGIEVKGKKRVNLDLSTPLQLIGRSAEFQHLVEVLAQDGDLLITGVPGSGRRTLVRAGAQEVGAIALEIDCIRATDGERFVQLLAEAISQNWQPAKIQGWVAQNAVEFFCFHPDGKLKLWRSLNQKQLWQAFEILLNLPQIMAVDLNKQAVIILQSFPHIRSWDRNGLWETTFRREIKAQTHVSYILIATIAETSHHADETNYPLETIQLAPLAKDVLAVWAREILHTQGLKFDSRSVALQLFLNAVQGHIGDAMSLIRRLPTLPSADGLITEKDVQQAIEGLLKDLSITFESLLMLLPANQVHLLESLALDPTEKPQSKEYIQKHGLSRGGSIQGALTGLQHKGLIYNAEQGYRLALPLLALWLRQRLS